MNRESVNPVVNVGIHTASEPSSDRSVAHPHLAAANSVLYGAMLGIAM